ncbi:MAG: winged helix-turn-helix domain-containing protein [Chloroflexota bacterium]|nr:winged helix-turn-helix domain-containing protein [Chloroflexota bacterium]
MAAQAKASLPLILVAHHAPDTAALLRSLLEREGYATVCAFNGQVAWSLIHQSRPVLALLDQALPLINGLELCRTLARGDGSPAIIILSDRPDELNKLLAFSAGADDYLTLPIHPRELLGRVNVALRRMERQADSAQPIVRRGRIELDPEQRRVRAAGQDVPLTALEFALLEIFIRHPGRVFSREELLNRLNGYLRGAPLDRAVDIHVSNLRHKLRQAMGESAPIETVRGAGYRLRIEPGDEAGRAADESDGGASLGQVALAALDRAPMPLLALSLDRTVLLYNQAAQRLCGWKMEEVAGQVKCYSLLGCHNPDGTLLCNGACPMRTALLHGVNDHQARYVITLKDGRETPVTAHYSRFSVDGAQGDCVLLALQPESADAAGLA